MRRLKKSSAVSYPPSTFTTAHRATVLRGVCSKCMARLPPPPCGPFYRSMGLLTYRLPLTASSQQLHRSCRLANSRLQRSAAAGRAARINSIRARSNAAAAEPLDR